MNTLLDEIHKQFLSMVPYIILIDKDMIYYVPFFMLFLLISKPIINKINNYFYDSYSYKIYERDGRSDNLYYTYITYLLEKHDLLKHAKHIECNDYFMDKNEKQANTGIWIYDYKIVPKLLPSDNTKIEFSYNNIKVNIFPGSADATKIVFEKKYYTITSPTYENIKRFLKYLDVIRIEYNQKYMYQDNYKYYHFDEGKTWSSSDINVNKTIDNIFLEQTIKSNIINNLENFINNKQQYLDFGMSRKISFLLHGEPGNGKSSLIYAIAKTYKRNIYKIDLTLSKSNFMTQINTIPQGSIIVFEDIDTISVSHDRSHQVEEENKKEKNKGNNDDINLENILEILDGYCYFNECMIFMTTNHIDKLDSALIRSGRMDHKVKFENVSEEQICQIIKYFYKKDIETNSIGKFPNISVSELINTIIIPNLNNYDHVVNYLAIGQ